MIGLLGFIREVFKPAAKLVDELHTSDDERLAAKAALLEVQVDFLEKGLDYETAQLEAKARIIEAEAKSEHWLTSTWRPATMVTFVLLTVAYWFGLTPDGLSEERVADVFDLIKIGLGGYLVGRSVEKVVPATVAAFKSKEQ